MRQASEERSAEFGGILTQPPTGIVIDIVGGFTHSVACEVGVTVKRYFGKRVGGQKV